MDQNNDDVLQRPTQVAESLQDPKKHAQIDNKTSQDPIIRSNSREASESTDATSIDTTKMTEQLRMVYKEVSESRTEKEAGAVGLGPSEAPHPSAIDPNDYEVYRKALICVPKFVSGFGIECQVAMSKRLNVERDDYKDYRLVADSLQLPTTSINVVEDMDNPMMKVFKQCGSKPGLDFVEALYKWGRFDVLKILVSYFEKERGSLSPSLSMEEPPKLLQRQRQLSSSLNEGRLQRKRAVNGVEETTDHPRSVSFGANPVQYDATPHSDVDQLEDEEGWNKDDLEFWKSITGDSKVFKQLKHVKKAFEKLLAEDSELKSKLGYWKLIVHTLKLDYSSSGSQIVTAENFRRMLAFLGSATNGDNGCIKRAGELAKKSMRKVKHNNETLSVSWFAGHMTPEDANERLASHSRGTFLVRFSTGEADKGWYVLSIKTESRGVFEFRIEQFQEGETRKFRLDGAEKEFESLADLVANFETDEMIKENDEGIVEMLRKVCPNLPLNEICKGYKKPKGSRTSRR